MLCLSGKRRGRQPGVVESETGPCSVVGLIVASGPFLARSPVDLTCLSSRVTPGSASIRRPPGSPPPRRPPPAAARESPAGGAGGRIPMWYSTRPPVAASFAILLALLFFSPVASAGQPKGVCVSPGGRFPAFSSEGKPPGRAPKGRRDLALCRIFRQNTCCDVTQTFPALISMRNLALTGEGSQECIHLWELLECSICDPRVGVRPGPPAICASFCDMVFKACSESYFSVDMKTQALSPCGLGDILCGKAHKWVSNGTELCRLAGFSVQVSGTSSGLVDDNFCYGGKASLDSISDSWTSSKDRPTLSGVTSWDVQDFQRWARDMPVGERVSWAIGGMVLTAGLIFISKRKSYSHRHKQAAIARNMRLRRLDPRANPQQTRRS